MSLPRKLVVSLGGSITMTRSATGMDAAVVVQER